MPKKSDTILMQYTFPLTSRLIYPVHVGSFNQISAMTISIGIQLK